VTLEPEQEQLLATLVEAARSQPDRSLRWFGTVAYLGGPEQVYSPAGQFPAAHSDMETLHRAGLLAVGLAGRDPRYTITPEGFGHYEEWKRRSGEPVEAVEEDVMRYIDGAAFRSAFPVAYGLWAEAADLLWGDDSERQQTTIGHKAREAMQACTNALVERYQPADVPTNPASVVARLRSVIEANRSRLGDARTELLYGMVGYWGGLSDVVQRQEHGAQREGDPLTFVDGRRVVFHAAVVMTELARELM